MARIPGRAARHPPLALVVAPVPPQPTSDALAAGHGGAEVAVSPSARATLRLALGLSIAVLVVLGTAGEISRLGFGHADLMGFVRLFGLGQEANVPTWYSSVTLLVAAAMAGMAGLHQRHAGSPVWWHWLLLAGLLTLMSLDESSAIHESLSVEVAYRMFGVAAAAVPWYVYYAWITPGAVVLGLVLWMLSSLWRSLLPPIRHQFTRAATTYFTGALGFEVLEAAWFAQVGTQNFVYSLLWTTQEFLEMTGVAALILALFDQLTLTRATIALRFGGPTTPLP